MFVWFGWLYLCDSGVWDRKRVWRQRHFTGVLCLHVAAPHAWLDIGWEQDTLEAVWLSLSTILAERKSVAGVLCFV